MNRIEGAVKSFRKDRGFGFIAVGAGLEAKDFFFHASQIPVDVDEDKFVKGLRVEFTPDYEVKRGNPVANQIVLAQ